MTSPVVSVVIPSYNHATFIGSAINSILSQTYQDFEIVIVDDGSRDGSNDVIGSFKDNRIRHFPLVQNIGAALTTNFGIERADGEFIAICNSDDTWKSYKLERQISFLNENIGIGAIFSDVDWIDDHGVIIPTRQVPFGNIFRQHNRSRHAWLRDLLLNGNRLCHPSILARKDVYVTCGKYNNWLRQLPDYEYWLRLLQKFEIFVLSEPLVNFRMHGGNASSATVENRIRNLAEYRVIARQFLGTISPENFNMAFSSTLDDHEANIVKFLLQATGPFDQVLRSIALEWIYRISQEEGGAPRLRAAGIEASDYYRLNAGEVVGHLTPLSVSAPKTIQETTTRELAEILGRRIKAKAKAILRRG